MDLSYNSRFKKFVIIITFKNYICRRNSTSKNVSAVPRSKSLYVSRSILVIIKYRNKILYESLESHEKIGLNINKAERVCFNNLSSKNFVV